MDTDENPFDRLARERLELTDEQQARLDRLLDSGQPNRMQGRHPPTTADEPPQTPEERAQRFKDSLGLKYEEAIANERQRLINQASDPIAKQKALGLSVAELLESMQARLDRLLGDSKPSVMRGRLLPNDYSYGRRRVRRLEP